MCNYFVHEFDSATDVEEFSNVRFMDKGNLENVVSMKVIEVNYPDSIEVVFIKTPFYLKHGNKLLNEIGLAPLDLGNTDAQILASMLSSVDGSKLYCFPTMKANNF